MNRIQELIHNGRGISVQCAAEIPCIAKGGSEKYYEEIFQKLDANISFISKICRVTTDFSRFTTLVLEGLNIKMGQQEMWDWVRKNEQKLVELISENPA